MPIFGNLLRIARERSTNRISGKKLSQRDLYELARKLEDPKPGTRAGVAFPASAKGQQELLIREFELGRRTPTAVQRELLEIALQLPAGVFQRDRFQTQDAFKEFLGQLQRQTEHRRWTDLQTRAERTIDDGFGASGATRIPPNPAGLKPAPLARPIPTHNAIAEEIEQYAAPMAGVDFRLCVVQGPAGVGKSTVVWGWWQSHGSKRISENFCAIDCTGKTSEEITRAISRYFLGSDVQGQETAGDNLILAMKKSGHSTLIFDGLTESAWLGNAIDTGSTDKKHFSIFKFREFISRIRKESVYCSIILSLQSDREHGDWLRISDTMSGRDDYTVIDVPLLSSTESVDLMRRLGVRLASSDMRRVAARAGGLPISVVAISEYLKASHETEIAHFITDSAQSGTQLEKFTEFFRRFQHGLGEAERSDKGFHPIAVIRVLGLMPGPIPAEWLDQLTDTVSITRLEHFSSKLLASNPVPFVIQSFGSLDVHALVRAEVRQDIDDALAEKSVDPNISRYEMKAIHLHMAALCYSIFSDKKSLNRNDITALEHFVYHMLRVREFVDIKVRSGDAFASDMDDGRFPNQSDPKSITLFCYNVAKKYLFDAKKYITRTLGRHESKASILKSFFKGAKIGGSAEYFENNDMVEILREISICYMHAGRIHLSLEATNKSLNLEKYLEV